MLINYKIVIRVIGVILMLFGGFMLLPALVALIYGTDDLVGFLGAAAISASIGFVMSRQRPDKDKIGKREGYLIVSMSWLATCILGSLPYMLSGYIPSFSGAVFEATSGLTTTGASVFNDIEALPQGILFWRSLTQWIGGMGVIVLTVAILPLLGIGGVELFVAEAPGPTSDKIHPRIQETAKRLWLIYVSLTVLLTLILFFISGMTFFDAINHALTTMSTGGFSTKNASMAAYDTPIVQYPIILFMFIAGMNYTVIYYALMRDFKKVMKSTEFRAYFIFVFLVSIVIGFIVHFGKGLPFEKAMRDALFQVVSLVTTTGFVSADYTAWGYGMTLVFFFLLFSGACTGSTSGGIKILRHLIFIRNSSLEFKRILHPKALLKIKIDKQLVPDRIITHILVFLLVYLLVFFIGSVVMISILYDADMPFSTALGAVATCIGNVGPGIGSVGPVDNFAWIPGAGKIILSILMVIGRLELFTFLIVFTPYFWKAN